MKTAKLERLKSAGWRVGDAEDFLQLSEEEAQLVALKLSLIGAVKKSRLKRNLSQIELAQRMKSSQSRIAKIESGDPSVSLDLIVRALIASGAKVRDIQEAFVSPSLAQQITAYDSKRHGGEAMTASSAVGAERL